MIKLFEIEPTHSNIRRFQTQLSVGKDYASFIIEDGVLKSYGYGDKGHGFYPYNKPYEIVKDIKDMAYQQL